MRVEYSGLMSNAYPKCEFRIVDLAGSERTDENYSNLISKEKRSELNSINNSLLILGQCISALGNTKNKHIPYRRSKLTRILKKSLSGDSKVLLISCISPSVSCAQETIQTLQFAKKAMKAKLGDPYKIRSPGSKTPDSGKSSIEKIRMAYEKEKSIRENLETFISENNMIELKAELEEIKKQNLDLSMKLQKTQKITEDTEIKPKKALIRHVRFASKVENEDILDEEEKERMEHNLKYRDDTIFDNMSIFSELLDGNGPYEKYFKEPENINNGYLGNYLLENDENEYKPKGKFALLNNSLTVQHDKMNNKHSTSQLPKNPNKISAIQTEEINQEFSNSPPIENSPQRNSPLHIEESAIVPNISDSNSLVAYESLQKDLEKLGTSQQQSSQGEIDPKISLQNSKNEELMLENPMFSAKIQEMYSKIMQEISELRKTLIKSPQKHTTTKIFENLQNEIQNFETGKTKNCLKIVDIVNQLQNIFDNVFFEEYYFRYSYMK